MIPSVDQERALRETTRAVRGKLRSDYSGRFMFGRQCSAIVCDNPIACAEEAASRGLLGARMDQMGLQFVVYWPEMGA